MYMYMYIMYVMYICVPYWCETLCVGAPEPVQRIEIWLDDAHWWLTQKDGQLEIADIKLTNFR